MAGIAQVGYMEGIGTGLGQNARVVFAMELKVQKLPFLQEECVFVFWKA